MKKSRPGSSQTRALTQIHSDTEVKVKFALRTNKLTGNLDRLPVPLLSDPCLVIETFLAEMSELGSVGLLKTEIRQRGSGRGSAEGKGRGGSSANAALINPLSCILAKNQHQLAQNQT